MVASAAGEFGHRRRADQPLIRLLVMVLALILVAAGAVVIGWAQLHKGQVPDGAAVLAGPSTDNRSQVQPLPDGLAAPGQLQHLSQVTPYSFYGHVVGWSVTGQVERPQIGSTMREFSAALAKQGWTAQPPGPTDVFAVRHVGDEWQLVKAAAVCPLLTTTCTVTILFATRSG